VVLQSEIPLSMQKELLILSLPGNAFRIIISKLFIVIAFISKIARKMRSILLISY